MPHDVAGGRITGIRGWICATSSLGSPVIIVQVRSHSPDSGSFQFSQSPAKVNGRPSFMAIAKRQLRFSRFAPFVKSVRRNQAPSLAECLPERRRFIDGLSSGVDGPISDLRFFDPIWNQSPLQGVERSLLDLRIEVGRILQLFLRKAVLSQNGSPHGFFHWTRSNRRIRRLSRGSASDGHPTMPESRACETFGTFVGI